MSKWLENTTRLIHNPQAVQKLVYSEMEAVLTGDRTVVATANPFAQLLESAVVCSSAAVVRNEANLRRVYPRMAMTPEELYHHMSDADYVGRFSTPANCTFRMMFNHEEMLSRAVMVPDSGLSKLTIPRNTQITVAGYTFTMHYPVDFRIMAHGGMQVVYDTEIVSPLKSLESNTLNWGYLNLDGRRFVYVDLPMDQFVVESATVSLTKMTTFRRDFQLNGEYYHARVFYSDANGGWHEMSTTHSDQVFDPFRPTALLKLIGNRLQVEVPTIYLTSGVVQNELRVDLYTTAGPIDVPLSSYNPNSFQIRWQDIERPGDTPYTAQFRLFSEMTMYALTDASGGAGQMTFQQLRERVITSAMGVPDLPITTSQLTDRLARRGYGMVLDVDQVTERQMLATRRLPPPTEDASRAGASSTIQTLQISMENLSRFTYCVNDNGLRMTIQPHALYNYNNGMIDIVPEATVVALNALPVDVRARRVNEARYLYSPFHYVFDINNDRFHLRPYYLDNPQVMAKSFIAEHDRSGIGVGVGDYLLEPVSGGFRLLISTASGDTWKSLPDDEAHCQLAYKPAGEIDLAYLNGTLTGMTAENERIYEFFLGTNYDIDEAHNLILTTFQMYDNGVRPHAVPLEHPFQVFFAVSGRGTELLTTSVVDDLLGKRLLPSDAIGLCQEELRIKLGSALTGLWAASRSVIGSEDYARYTADVPWLYEADVYERDPVSGAIIIERDPVTQELGYRILHRAGEPMLDVNGYPLYRYRAGDIQMDPEGKPIAISSRKMVRLADIFMLDGVYWFATETSAVEYAERLARTVVTWLETDIADVQEVLLERTNLFFYAQSSLGSVRAITGHEKPTYVDAAQSFTVEYSVTAQVFRDTEMRRSLENIARSTIIKALESSVVAVSDIVREITERAGGNIIAVRVLGLGGLENYPVVSLLDDSNRLSVRRIAEDRSDGTIGVIDDISVGFVQHRS